jgi:hypothetical protein
LSNGRYVVKIEQNGLVNAKNIILKWSNIFWFFLERIFGMAESPFFYEVLVIIGL